MKFSTTTKGVSQQKNSIVGKDQLSKSIREETNGSRGRPIEFWECGEDHLWITLSYRGTSQGCMWCKRLR